MANTNRSGGQDPRSRAINEQIMRRNAARRRKSRQEFYRTASRVFVLALGALIVFSAALIFILARDFSKAPEKYSYSLKVVKDDSKFALKNGIAVKNNVCYVSLSDLSEAIGYKMMGNVDVMNAVIDDDNSLSFYVNTDIASVNGNNVSVGAPSYFSYTGGDVYVPVTFFDGVLDGVDLVTERRGKNVNYTINISSSEMALAYSKNTPADKVEGLRRTAAPTTDFVADLSEYEQYMNPENADEYIRLINTEYPLGKDYIPTDLMDVADTRKDRAAQQMREYAAKALEAMFIEMRANGISDVSVTSGYRSYAYQEQLFNNSLANFRKSYDYDTAYAKTASEIAIPGTSEHQSGLCADLHNLPSASQRFESTDAYKWLYANCANFGFILRFPKDKQDITGIIFEPWHYRYVGRYHAQKIMQQGLCLEEYCKQNNIGI